MKKILNVFIVFLILAINSYGRNIFVVYDDSGSMKKENRWIYANYAMQTLVSLLDSNDKLTIVKMSDYKNNFKNTKEINSKNIETELLNIKKSLKAPSNETPYSAVEYTIDQMIKTTSKEDSNWMVVITDGKFEDGKPLGVSKIEEVKKSISKLIKETAAKPIFLLIGSNEDELSEVKNQEGIVLWKEVYGEGEYPKIFCSLGEESIINRIREIASLVTSQSSKKNNINKEIKGNTMEFSTAIPLNRIIILQQGEGEYSPNKIKKVTSEKILNFDKEYISSTEDKKILLNASIMPIREIDGKSISGKIKIEFENEIKNNIDVIYEANVRLNYKVIDSEEKEVKESLIEKEAGEKIKIQAYLIDMEKKQKLNYMKDIEVIATYGKEKYKLKYNSKLDIYETEIEVSLGKKSIDIISEFSGYFYFQSDIYTIVGIKPLCPLGTDAIECGYLRDPSSRPIPLPPRDLKLNVKLEPNIGELKYSDFKIAKFIITPTIDGSHVYTKDKSSIKIYFDAGIEGELIEKRDNNDRVIFEFIPKFNTNYSKYKNPYGDKKFIASIEGFPIDKKYQETGNYSIEKGSFWDIWKIWIFTIFLPIIGFFIVLGYITRNKFHKNAVIVLKDNSDSYKRVDKKIKLEGKLYEKIMPFKDYSDIKESIIFYAHNKNKIRVTEENMKNLFSGPRIKKLIIAGNEIDREDWNNKNKGKKKSNKEFRMDNGDSIEIRYVNDNKIKEYKYFYKK